MIVVVHTREHSKNKQDNIFCRDLFVFIIGLFVCISVTTTVFVTETISQVRDLNHGILYIP